MHIPSSSYFNFLLYLCLHFCCFNVHNQNSGSYFHSNLNFCCCFYFYLEIHLSSLSIIILKFIFLYYNHIFIIFLFSFYFFFFNFFLQFEQKIRSLSVHSRHTSNACSLRNMQILYFCMFFTYWHTYYGWMYARIVNIC